MPDTETVQEHGKTARVGSEVAICIKEDGCFLVDLGALIIAETSGNAYCSYSRTVRARLRSLRSPARYPLGD